MRHQAGSRQLLSFYIEHWTPQMTPYPFGNPLKRAGFEGANISCVTHAQLQGWIQPSPSGMLLEHVHGGKPRIVAHHVGHVVAFPSSGKLLQIQLNDVYPGLRIYIETILHDIMCTSHPKWIHKHKLNNDKHVIKGQDLSEHTRPLISSNILMTNQLINSRRE